MHANIFWAELAAFLPLLVNAKLPSAAEGFALQAIAPPLAMNARINPAALTASVRPVVGATPCAAAGFAFPCKRTMRALLWKRKRWIEPAAARLMQEPFAEADAAARLALPLFASMQANRVHFSSGFHGWLLHRFLLGTYVSILGSGNDAFYGI